MDTCSDKSKSNISQEWVDLFLDHNKSIKTDLAQLQSLTQALFHILHKTTGEISLEKLQSNLTQCIQADDLINQMVCNLTSQISCFDLFLLQMNEINEKNKELSLQDVKLFHEKIKKFIDNRSKVSQISLNKGDIDLFTDE